MKVQKTSAQPTFQPIELTITIESFEEKQALRSLFYSEITTPETLRKAGVISEDSVKILRSICIAFQKCI